jgi:hypothetical protein
MGFTLKSIHIIAIISVCLVVSLVVIGSVIMFKPETDEPKTENDLNPTEPESNEQEQQGTSDTQNEIVDIPWLKEGYRWFIHWTSLTKGASDSTRWSNYEQGFYTMKLGAPQEKGGMQMYEVILDGDTQSCTPKWRWIGTDNYGKIYGLKADADTPAFIFSYVDDETAHSGFYGNFDDNKQISVNRNGNMPSSQYTVQSGFSGTLSSVGYSENNVHYDEAGATYFPGYGTIYTEGGTGAGPDVDNKMHAEYWSLEAGPVGMHYLSNYENYLGWWGSEKHYETYIVVTSFGDKSLILPHFETEPDSYDDPTVISIDAVEEQDIEGIYMYIIVGQIDQYDYPSDNVEEAYDNVLHIQDEEIRSAGLEKAKRVQDWYKFEITESDVNRNFEFYLCWNTEETMNLHLFTAPDNPTYGFLWLGGNQFTDTITDFNHSLGYSGTFQPGTYLLGVERTTSENSIAAYGLMVLLD